MFLANFLSLSIVLASFGALLPDLIDKPLVLIGIAPLGRYIGHTLFTAVVSSIVTFLITKNKNYGLSIGFGCIFHLFEDLPGFIPWFYPFVDYDFPSVPLKIKYTFLMFSLDVIGLISIYYITQKNHEFSILFENIKVKIFKNFNR